jgi:hypothetical protein
MFVLRENAVVAVVVRRAEAAVDLGGGEDEAAAAAEGDDRVHRHRLCRLRHARRLPGRFALTRHDVSTPAAKAAGVIWRPRVGGGLGWTQMGRGSAPRYAPDRRCERAGRATRRLRRHRRRPAAAASSRRSRRSSRNRTSSRSATRASSPRTTSSSPVNRMRGRPGGRRLHARPAAAPRSDAHALAAGAPPLLRPARPSDRRRRPRLGPAATMTPGSRPAAQLRVLQADGGDRVRRPLRTTASRTASTTRTSSSLASPALEDPALDLPRLPRPQGGERPCREGDRAAARAVRGRPAQVRRA